MALSIPSRRRFKLAGIVPVCIAVLLGWLILALLGPWLLPQDPSEFLSDDPFASAPGALLGTDYMGRDLFSRLIDGTRMTLGMSLLATMVAHLVGVTTGIAAAARGGVLDMVFSRIAELILSLPKIIVGLVFIAALGPSFPVLVIVTGVVYSASVFRLARSLAADVLVLDFIRVARARGESLVWILFSETLPNIFRPLLADFALRLSFAILFISNLSFLGLGVQPPHADWGGLVRENIAALAQGGLAPLFPALAIASVTIALNLLVDAWSDDSRITLGK
ncbi:ABC transporter permease [Paracandidimonas soli]|uniref:ABC transporter permease n=1 Tax=Paracandidimonas soli TaxID=1917182 RepID=UPI0033400103